MKEIFEVWLGVFFLALLMVGGVSIIGAGIDARNADATKTSYIAEIENSNFSPSVLTGVLADAADQDYEVSLDVYNRDDAGVQTVTKNVTSASGLPDTSETYMVRVSLKFDYSFALFDAVAKSTLVGYAR